MRERKRFNSDKIPLRAFDLLRDKVKGVPAGVGEECRIQRQGDVARIGARSLEGRLKVVSVTCGNVIY